MLFVTTFLFQRSGVQMSTVGDYSSSSCSRRFGVGRGIA